MTQRRPPGQRQRDPENEVPTIAPDLDEDVPVEPLTLRDPTLEVEHVGLRPKPKKPAKKGAGPVAWIVAIVLIGGIGAAVALVMTGALGGGGEPTPATTTAAATAESDSGAGESAAAAGEDAGAAEETTEAAAEDDAGEPAETAAAGAEDDATAVAAGDVDEEATEEEVAVADDAVAAADVDEEATEEVAIAAADGESAPGPDDDAAVAATDDVAPAEDATAAALADGEAATTVVSADATTGTDAAPPVEVVAVAKPPNPAEAKRLNDLGFAARKAGDHATAMARYREAVQADPDNVWAHYNLACELALAGQAKDALAELVAVHKLGTPEAKKALAAARKDSDFESLRDLGQFQRLTR